MQDSVKVMPKIVGHLAIDWLANPTNNRRKYWPLGNRTLEYNRKIPSTYIDFLFFRAFFYL
jgi:hypothetical protein